MSSLIVAVVFGLIFAYFATQNTQGVTLQIGNYIWTNIPLYLIALGSLLVGLLISWLISVVDTLANMITLQRKNFKIEQSNRHAEDLNHKITELEKENARLKGKTEPIIISSSHENPTPRRSFFDRLRLSH